MNRRVDHLGQFENARPQQIGLAYTTPVGTMQTTFMVISPTPERALTTANFHMSLIIKAMMGDPADGMSGDVSLN